MAGTIAVHAEQPGLGRAGTLGVAVDGVSVGKVKQGDTAHFPIEPGTHTVRVSAKDRSHSNTVTVEVQEGQDTRVRARGTGLGAALLLPAAAAIGVPPIYATVAIMVMGALLYLVPGLLFRVRAEGEPELRSANAATPATTGTADPEGAGLWWESDPALAKRYRKSADA